jgi:NTP pyrophosphatase (non-canonical NTP hydrolase)
MTTINALVKAAHDNAVSKGWWEEDRSFGEVIALIHSEVSEALEFYREGHNPDELFYTKDGTKPDGIPAELADVVIRIFDACGRYGIDLEAAILEKMAYNATRPHKHGGKVI